MRTATLVLAFVFAAFAAPPRNQQKIVGGTVTDIAEYPYGTSLMYSWNLLTYHQSCGGTIINSRAIITAAHCVYGDTANRWRARVGSSLANSGGVVHELQAILVHPDYRTDTLDSDVAIIYTSTVIVFSDVVAPIAIAAPSYDLPDNSSVMAIGWGTTSAEGTQSEQLRHVEVRTVNQATCRQRYAEVDRTVTNTMLCSGWLDEGGRDQCQGDSGGPLVHNHVLVGVCSWRQSCALAYFPGVNARVSRFTNWIAANA